MIYELSHYVKNHMGVVWECVEKLNAELFGVQHKKALMVIPDILRKYDDQFSFCSVTNNDVQPLAKFFSEQPQSAFEFFHPHDFDAATLAKLAKRKSFLMYIVKDDEDIVGYFFLRCFANGNSFKGRMVDYHHRNQGIGKIMGNVLNDIVSTLNLKLFTTISPDNYASLASVKAVNEIRIVRTLKNGYYYIECTPKHQSVVNRGGEI